MLAMRRFTPLVLAFVLIFPIFSAPVTAQTQGATISRPSIGEGIYPHLSGIQDDMDRRLGDRSILKETRGVLDQMVTVEVEKADPMANAVVESPVPLMPVEPDLIDKAKGNYSVGVYQNALDLLRNDPRQYVLYTNTSEYEAWNNATFSLLFPEWIYADLDGDGLYDIRVQLEVIVPLDQVNPRPPISTTAEIHLDIQNDGGWSKPVSLHFLKGMNYTRGDQDRTAIFTLGLEFQRLPSRFQSVVEVKNLELGGNALEMLTGDRGEILHIGGPYRIHYEIHENIPSLNLTTSFTEDEAEVNQAKNWAHMRFNAGDRPSIPYTLDVQAASQDIYTGFDDLQYEADRRTDFSVEFCEVEENTTYAEAKVMNLPHTMNITLSNKTTEAGEINSVRYTASEVMDSMEYTEFQYFGARPEDLTPYTPYRYIYTKMDDIPTSIILEGTFSIGQDLPLSDLNFTGSFVGSIVDNVVSRVAARFYRIARSISSLPDNILSAAGEGGAILLDASTPFDVEFRLASGEYTLHADPEVNFFAFQNQEYDSPYPLANVSITGRLLGVTYINGVVGNETDMEVQMGNGRSLHGYFVDTSQGFRSVVNVSNLPGRFSMELERDTIAFEVPVNEEPMRQVRYLGYSGEHYMAFDIHDIPRIINMKRTNDSMRIYTGGLDAIGKATFVLTNGTPSMLEGNHLYLDDRADEYAISGTLTDLRGVEYNSTSRYMALDFETEKQFNVSISSEAAGGLVMQMVLDPLPAHISTVLPEIPGRENITLPNLLNITGVLGVVSLAMALADLSTTLVETIRSGIANLVGGIGTFGTNITFSYEATVSPTITARFQVGRAIVLDELPWLHGLSVKQVDIGGKTEMAGKVYLQGLAKKATISIRTGEDSNFLYARFEDYAPRHDYLFFNIEGFQGRDFLVYISGVEPHANLEFSVDLKFNPGMHVSDLVAWINASITDKLGHPLGLGAFVVKGKLHEPVLTTVDIVIPSVPSSLSAFIAVRNGVEINYRASEEVPYLFLKMTRKMYGEFHHAVLLLNDIPTSIQVDIILNTHINIGESLFQSVPSIFLTSSTSTLDLYLQADGAVMGQRGRYEIQVNNVATRIDSKIVGKRLELRSSGTEFISVMVQDIPASRQFYLDSLEFRVEELETMDVTLNMLFGAFPLIDLDNIQTGNIQFRLQADYLGSRFTMPLNILVTDFNFIEGRTTDIPTSPHFLTNGGTVRMAGTSRHILLPEIALTVLISLPGVVMG